MEILFLGTSSGTPTKTRNVSALALRLSQSRMWYLVDCGEGTQHRILHTALSLLDLQAIFITHIHGDHCYGLPGLLASAGMLNRTRSLKIAGPPEVENFLRAVINITQLRLPYTLDYVDVQNSPAMSPFSDLHVHATPLSHRVPSYAYSFCEKTVKSKLDVAKLEQEGIPAGPLWSRIQEGQDDILPDGRHIRAADYLLPTRKPRKIIIGGDNDTPELLKAEAEETNVLVHEATYTQEVLDKVGLAAQHSSAKAVAQFAEALRIPNLVLTHFSPRYQERKGVGFSALEEEARRYYSGNLFLAYDGARYLLDKEGYLNRVP